MIRIAATMSIGNWSNPADDHITGFTCDFFHRKLAFGP